MRLEMIERFTNRSDRGQFLAKAGSATLAVVAGRMVGGAAPAHAHGEWQGCNLCNAASAGCPSNIACFWCWWGDCHKHESGGTCHQHQCCEGYKAGAGCGGGCPATCSAITSRRESVCGSRCPVT
jgi:hypothetical protein